MTDSVQAQTKLNRVDCVLILLRCALGGWFIYGGLMKGMHPVEFLKTLHEYHLPFPFLILNSVAGLLPWFEVLCGLLLITGKALRAAALLWLMMLIPFTWLVLQRALDLQSLSGLPFCAVRFDCGCGMGEIGICTKLTENLLLIASAAILLFCSGNPLRQRYEPQGRP